MEVQGLIDSLRVFDPSMKVRILYEGMLFEFEMQDVHRAFGAPVDYVVIEPTILLPIEDEKSDR